ncbi:MAG: hypothetical protein ACYDCQ_21365, partial [Dehalococcoidia bacterium]
VYPNEAHTWDRLGRRSEGPNLLENAIEQWFPFATGRHTWISIQGQTIRGVVSARGRGSRLAWEVDCLIVADEEAEPVLAALLEQLTRGAAAAKVLRIFLRVRAESALIEAARRHGFVPITPEFLLRFNGETPAIGPASDVVIRPRDRGDGFALFRLYNAVTPPEVRWLEAATYAEWIAAQEKRGGGRGRLDVVAELDGQIVAWVRAVQDDQIGRLDLLASPEASAQLPSLLSAALAALGSRRPAFCLAAAHAHGLAAFLQDAGFEQAEEYMSLVKRVAIPIHEAKPVRAAVPQPLATA